MVENKSWEIESIDKARTNMVLKKGNSKLELYATIPPPSKWTAGDKIAEPERREDARSDRMVTIENKTKGGKIDVHIINAYGDFLKSISPAEETQYPNLYKRQKIEAHEKGAIRLKDDSVWLIAKDASLPSNEVLNVGDEVDIEPYGTMRPGEKTKSYKVVKDPKKQGFRVLWVNPSDKGIKDYTITKSRKGNISDGSPSEIKLGDKYPDEWLNQKWKISEVLWDSEYDDEKETELNDDSIVVADPGSSKWKMTSLNVSKNNYRNWEAGQTVLISKHESGMTTYWIKNLDIPNSEIGVSFMGWAESKF